MATKKDKNEVIIRKAILSPIESGNGEWKNIAASVKNTSVKITNWVKDVRGVLQELLNEGLIARNESVTGEVYELVRKPQKEYKWVKGDWYTSDDGWLVNYQRGNHSYGFSPTGWYQGSGNWRVEVNTLEENDYYGALHLDILDRLVAEAKKRGLIAGVTYTKVVDGLQHTIPPNIPLMYSLSKDKRQLIVNGTYTIFDNGKWVYVVEESKDKKEPKEEWEVGTWYKSGVNDYLINYQRGSEVYGFDDDGWVATSNGRWSFPIDQLEQYKYVEATKRDIKDRLIAEARKRGYNDGTTIKQIHQKTPLTLQGGIFAFNYDMDSNSLTLDNSGGSYLIFDSGKWAEIVTKAEPKEVDYDLPFKVGEYYETADGTIVLIWVIEFEDGEVFVREQKGNTQITYTTNEVKYFIEQGDWVKQEKTPTIETRQEFEAQLVEYLVSAEGFTNSDAQGFIETKTNQEIIDSEYKPNTIINIAKVVNKMLEKGIPTEAKKPYEVGDIFQVSDTTLWEITSIDNGWVGYARLDKTNPQTGSKDQVDNYFENGDWEIIPFRIGDFFKVTPNKESVLRWQITSVVNGEVRYEETETRSDYTETLSYFIGQLKKGIYAIVKEEQKPYKVGDLFRVNTWPVGEIGKILAINGGREHNEIQFDFSDDNGVTWGYKHSIKVDNFERELAIDNIVILPMQELTGYENNTQEELKTLLRTYTSLAEKGNEDAKKEIVILQTLIK